MALNGYIKLHRKLREWGWYSDSVVKDVFLELLLTANFTPKHYKGFRLRPGQAVIGRKKLAETLGFSEQQVRTALNKLQKTGEISVFSTNKFTVVTIENWGFYQGEEEDCNQQSTNNQPTNNQQSTNNQPHLKKDKKDKKDKNERSVCVDDALTQLNDVIDIYKFDFKTKDALYAWVMYKTERGEMYTDTTIRSLLVMVERYVHRYNSEMVATLIEECIASGYKNIVFDRLDR